MTGRVHVERDDDVVVLLIDNPPVNAASADIRRELLEQIVRFQADSSLRAAVIIGAGSTFIAGSDLKEFGLPLQDPQLPTVITAIESCAKPVVAALHGAALGGGFELALACDARIATPETVVGLPEVTLGIVPGAGGTQRLPRLVGVPRAIEMICRGERVLAAKALSMHLIDEIASIDLRRAAVELARTLVGAKRLVRDMSVPSSTSTDIALASRDALRAGKNRPAVRAAAELVEAAAQVEFSIGLAHERLAFQTLRLSREARALRYQFFSEREATKHRAPQGIEPNEVVRIAVIGAGTMGTGIAISALDAGFDVILLEQDAGALERGVTRIRDYYEGRVKTKKLDETEASCRLLKLSATMGWERLRTADLVIEAVFEKLEVKQEVFRRIDVFARPGAILASNTSYLDLDAIASATARPQDVVGLHFFSPAHVMRLLEVVRGAATSPAALVTSLHVAKRLRKLPVVTANAFGFIGNRIYSAYRRQCEFMLEEGAYPDQVDAALEAFGFAMGPFAVGDMSGLDIAWYIRQSQAASRSSTARYVRIPDLLCEMGRLGRKTGAGYYTYLDGKKAELRDAQVVALIDSVSRTAGITRRALTDKEIQRRAMLAMVNEVGLLLAEKVAQRASDCDVVLVNGYGFPRWEGGVVFWAQERGQDALALDLIWLGEVSGPGFVQCDLNFLFPVGE